MALAAVCPTTDYSRGVVSSAGLPTAATFVRDLGHATAKVLSRADKLDAAALGALREGLSHLGHAALQITRLVDGQLALLETSQKLTPDLLQQLRIVEHQIALLNLQDEGTLDRIPHDRLARLVVGRTPTAPTADGIGSASLLPPPRLTAMAVEGMPITELTRMQHVRAVHNWLAYALVADLDGLAPATQALITGLVGTLREVTETARIFHEGMSVDGLTQLYRRAAAASRMEHELFQRGRGTEAYERTLGTDIMMMADIDHFKQFNDKHGHAFGDIVLAAVAGVLLSIVKRRDDIVASRYGGEEFWVLAFGAGLAGGHILADRIHEGVRALQFKASSGQEVGVTVSIGMTEMPSNLLEVSADTDPREVMARIRAELERTRERADIALYNAKAVLGRNTTSEYRDSMTMPDKK